MHTSDVPPDNTLLTFDDLITAIGIKVSKTTIWRWERLGLFPRRVRLAGCMVAWKRSEVLAWLQEQLDNREKYMPLGDVR